MSKEEILPESVGLKQHSWSKEQETDIWEKVKQQMKKSLTGNLKD
jgi:hypothetical protein